MTRTYLDDIVLAHRARAMRDERDWRDRVDDVRSIGPSLLAALRNEHDPHVKVIAEVKRRSPSRGDLAMGVDAGELAATYQAAGAAAISVLTDAEFFAGSPQDLAAVRARVEVPVLRKDFTVAENDVLDAAEMGASAVLLIVAALSDGELERFIALSEVCGLDALVEVHDVNEAHRALAAGARLVGVNQRNLRTFDVDTDLAARVVASLDGADVRVCESGLRDRADVERAAQNGFDAVLVGETFVTAPDVVRTVHEFATVERRRA